MSHGELGALLIEGIEFVDDFADKPVSVQRRDAGEPAGDAGAIAPLEVVLKCLAIAIQQRHDRERCVGAQELQLANDILEQNALTQVVETIDDILDAQVGAARQFIGLLIDEDGRIKRLLDFAERDLDRPGIGGVESGEADENDRPPFLEVEHSGEVRVERVEEGDLPVQMVRELGEHDPEQVSGIGQREQLIDEEMTRSLEGLPGFLG